MAPRVHPFPSRTRKLSWAAPKILGWRRPGKIGRRRHYKAIVQQGGCFFYCFILRFWGYCIYLDCCKIGLLRSVCAGAASIPLTTISYLLRSGRGDGVFLRLCLYLIYCNILPFALGPRGHPFSVWTEMRKRSKKERVILGRAFAKCLPRGQTPKKEKDKEIRAN